MLKRFIALVMILVVICTLCVGCKKNKNVNPENNASAPTNATENTVSSENTEEKEDILNQEISAGTLIIGSPSSNFTVTVKSDYFANTKDIVNIADGTVKNESTVFLTQMMNVGDMYIGSIDSHFHSKDVVNISMEKAQTERAQFSLNGNGMEMNINTVSQSVFMSLGSKYVKITNLDEDFSYRIMEMGVENTFDITIDGYLSGEKGDVEIFYENGMYIVTSTKKLHGLYVMASGNNGEGAFNTNSSHISDISYKYQIAIGEDGNITITAIS